MSHVNYNLDETVMPIKVDELEWLLNNTNYDKRKKWVQKRV